MTITIKLEQTIVGNDKRKLNTDIVSQAEKYENYCHFHDDQPGKKLTTVFRFSTNISSLDVFSCPQVFGKNEAYHNKINSLSKYFFIIWVLSRI